MSKKKDPPGYPGDEAIKKNFGEVMRELRLEKGLSIEEVYRQIHMTSASRSKGSAAARAQRQPGR